MDEKKFDRIEKKYLLDKKQEIALQEIVKSHMVADNYHVSEVFNIYFDTENYDLIIKSIESPHFKQKLRARSYAGYDKVFLEIKTKLKSQDANVGYKRRVLITHDDYQKFISGEKSAASLANKKIEQPTDLQIATEVDHLVNHFHLIPRILVYYERTSFISEHGLRITFDRNLSYRTDHLDFTKTSSDQHYFSPPTTIMEIKAHGALPLWLVHALSENKAYPQKFSKIGHVYQKIYARKT